MFGSWWAWKSAHHRDGRTFRLQADRHLDKRKGPGYFPTTGIRPACLNGWPAIGVGLPRKSCSSDGCYRECRCHAHCFACMISVPDLSRTPGSMPQALAWVMNSSLGLSHAHAMQGAWHPAQFLS